MLHSQNCGRGKARGGPTIIEPTYKNFQSIGAWKSSQILTKLQSLRAFPETPFDRKSNSLKYFTVRKPILYLKYISEPCVTHLHLCLPFSPSLIYYSTNTQLVNKIHNFFAISQDQKPMSNNIKGAIWNYIRPFY